MFKWALQKYAKHSYFLAIGLFYSQFASSANINLVLEDQHGQKLSGAVVEIINASTHSAPKTLPLAVMDQVHKQFLPELLVVQQGQQVNFPNSDNIRHHVYSFSQAKPFQLRLYSGQPKEPITFDQQGVVVLGCNIHDSMVGYIYVASSESVYKSDQKGLISLTFDTLPAQVSVWHPLQTAPLENKKIITINSQKQLLVTVNTSSPAPRNTFGSKFKAGND
ncbi:methylamine utilization protein [Pseudoalteromonas carrageenovora]|uniref:methylamine utilization protein n=1 Tax=Pseudoalteromonas carrageenovora TaxID=227 RepID=UPI0026E2376C|nr:methylamine utilization protein [Pseudoalteromonas carrageenovora]MDO6638256.1 methylamine utilization protein [Pseudoalteromonas carrageenovora]MDO6650651.1 methylamine utilization protein [Pseudoalteromonas carrageenovora]